MWYASDSVKKIVIEEGITTIGDQAFADCRELESITIPDGVTSIGSFAFANCEKLETITIKNPNCKFFDSNSVICNDYDSVTKTVTADFTIIGKAGSTAEEYAQKNNITFKEDE